jgi:TolB protein
MHIPTSTRAHDAVRLSFSLAVVFSVAGCQDAERPAGPPLASPELNQSAGPGLHGRIAFHSNCDGDFEIYVMNADGTGVTQLTHNSTYDFFEPSWSPNGRQIGFCGNGVSVMNGDGTGITQLTDDGCLVVWSPNGRQIAFNSNRDGDEEVYVMNADGTGVTQLTHNFANDAPRDWSPDGRRIAFVSDRNGNRDLYVMNVDGSGVTQLTDHPADDEGDYAQWSPNGRRFVFSSRRDGGDFDIFVMNADGTGVTQLTHNDGIDDDDPVWSPNGRQIASTR